jgi:hypothetical protein
MAHRPASSPDAAHGERTNAAVVEDPCSVVRQMLAEYAPCETGYPGVSWCRVCGSGRDWCADVLERVLKERYPSVDWTPAIREVLGIW